jgi:hypothetical protein
MAGVGAPAGRAAAAPEPEAAFSAGASGAVAVVPGMAAADLLAGAMVGRPLAAGVASARAQASATAALAAILFKISPALFLTV